MSDSNEVIIAGACRTSIGALQGALSSLTAPQLGSIVIKEAVSRAGILLQMNWASTSPE